MKTVISVLSIILLVLNPVFAAEQGDTYAALQYAQINYDEDGFDEAFEPGALVLRMGKVINENVSAEGRFGIGIQDDEVDLGPFDTELDVNHIIGVYALLHTAVGKDSLFYANVIGYSQIELELEAFGISADRR